MKQIALLIVMPGLLGTLAHAQLAVPPVIAPHENLQATLWAQSALERDVLCRQSFRMAQVQLSCALRQPGWSAMAERSACYGQRPAVILDVDETVLDNTPYNARLVKRGISYDRDLWNAWVDEATAEPIAGATEFLRFAVRSGVSVFFVTNRDAELKTKTVENLQRVFDIPVSEHNVLLKNERPNWTSDKSSRRLYIARSHRVLLLIGDDFNDFVKLPDVGIDERRKIGLRYSNYFGTRWILLPNPMYGSWEKAVFGYRFDLSREDAIELKRELLDTDD